MMNKTAAEDEEKGTSTKDELLDKIEKRESKRRTSSEERSSWSEKLVGCLCCHSCGSTWCMRGTKSRRCAKKFFKMMAVG